MKPWLALLAALAVLAPGLAMAECPTGQVRDPETGKCRPEGSTDMVYSAGKADSGGKTGSADMSSTADRSDSGGKMDTGKADSAGSGSHGSHAGAPPPVQPGSLLGSVVGGIAGSIQYKSPPSKAKPGAPLIPVRAYLHAADIPPRGIGAYGVVAFRARPTPVTRDAMLKACAAFKAYLPKQSSLPASVTLDEQMLTVWPLDTPGAPQAEADDCGYVIDHYDLVGGLQAIGDAARQGGKVSGAGPFLIGWSPASARGIPDRLVLVVDMSGDNTQAQFNESFHFWQEKVVLNPKLWRSGFSMEQLRLAIQDFANTYGAALLPAVSMSHMGTP